MKINIILKISIFISEYIFGAKIQIIDRFLELFLDQSFFEFLNFRALSDQGQNIMLWKTEKLCKIVIEFW